MVQRVYLIVHSREDFEKHPNALGLLIRRDENGAPLLDRIGNYKPVSPQRARLHYLLDREEFFPRANS